MGWGVTPSVAVAIDTCPAFKEGGLVHSGGRCVSLGAELSFSSMGEMKLDSPTKS